MGKDLFAMISKAKSQRPVLQPGQMQRFQDFEDLASTSV
jgi:hypothetical protein